MDRNILGIIVSLVFIFGVIGVSTILLKIKWLSNEGSRKFIHIVLSGWWIIAMKYFDNIYYASFVPLLFVVVNYISYKKAIFKSMEREDKSVNDLGTVYYVVTLFILAITTLGNEELKYIGAIGIFVMGFGDGFAAVIGKKFGKAKYEIFNSKRTVEGTLTMFVVSFIVIAIILNIYTPIGVAELIIKTLIISIIATILEGITPYGLDNLSVPLGTSLVSYILLNLL